MKRQIHITGDFACLYVPGERTVTIGSNNFALAPFFD